MPANSTSQSGNETEVNAATAAVASGVTTSMKLATGHLAFHDDGHVLPTMFTLLVRRLKSPKNFHLRGFFGSVITSLGQSAFFAISCCLGFCALAGQYFAKYMRQPLHAGQELPEWVHRLIIRVKSSTGALKYENVAASLFDKSSGDDAGIDQAELYCLCLGLYCTTTQYMPQVLTPPTRAHTDALFRAFDLGALRNLKTRRCTAQTHCTDTWNLSRGRLMSLATLARPLQSHFGSPPPPLTPRLLLSSGIPDGSGVLDREEFLLLCSVFYESLLMRIAAQSTVSLLLAPLVASHIVEFCAGLPVSGGAAGAAIGAAAAAQTFGNLTYMHLPEQLQPIMGSRAVAVTGVAATLVAVLVPLILSLIDEYYLLRAARKTSRKLFKRRSMASQSTMQLAAEPNPEPVPAPAPASAPASAPALAMPVRGEGEVAAAEVAAPEAIRAYSGDVVPASPVPEEVPEEEVVLVESAAAVADTTESTSATPAAAASKPSKSWFGLGRTKAKHAKAA